MLKAKAELVDLKRDELKNEIETIEERAHNEAVNTGNNNGWDEALVGKYSDFLMKEDPRYNVEAKEKELNYLESNFCEEVEDETPEEANTDNEEF